MEARTWVEVDRDVAELLVTIAPRCGLGADSRFRLGVCVDLRWW